MKTSDKSTYSYDIHAYIDGELSAVERADFERLLTQDASLKAEVCELRKIKQQMLEHYQKVNVPPLAKNTVNFTQRQWGWAASILLSVGLGFLISQGVGNLGQNSPLPPLQVAQSEDNKVVLHIDSSQPSRTHALLQKASAMLNASQTEVNPIEIEIVANHEGIELFEQENPSREAIIALLAQYDNLKLVACQRALERRAKNGHPVHLIDKVESDKAAIDVIIDKMQQGWRYYKF